VRVAKLTEIEDQTSTQRAAITKGRMKLQRDIIQWREYQFKHFPQLHDHCPPVDVSAPEVATLSLPSAFTPSMRTSLGLEKFATIEYDLREGQAHDALHAVREAIKTFNYNLAFKKVNIHGQSANTRAQTFLKSLAADKVSAGDKYRRARAALLKLGLSESDSVFRPLENKDLWMKNVSMPRQMGDDDKPDPWFWTVGRPGGMTQEEESEWSRESKCL